MTAVLETPVAAHADDRVPAAANTMKAKALFTALSDALLFAAPPAMRLPFLEAVRLECGGGQLVAVATDRFVLGASRAEYSGAPFMVVVAGSDAKALVKMAKTVKRDETSREVTIEVADAGAEMTFRFSTGESMIVRGLGRDVPEVAPADPGGCCTDGRHCRHGL